MTYSVAKHFLRRFEILLDNANVLPGIVPGIKSNFVGQFNPFSGCTIPKLVQSLLGLLFLQCSWYQTW